MSELAPALVELARRAHARGWLPATSGNLSARIDANTLEWTWDEASASGLIRFAKMRGISRRVGTSAPVLRHEQNQ